MFDWLKPRPKEKPLQDARFNHILDFAKALANKNPAGLIYSELILLRPLQAEALLSAIENEMHGARQSIGDSTFFMPDGPHDIQMGFDYPRLDPDKFLVHLNRDPVLPCPWNRSWYIGTLSDIGHGKPSGDWREDTTNHFVSVWLPWGLAFVKGGNHSIAAGIAGGEGVLRPNEVSDMSRLLDLVHCDGEYYRSAADGQILDRVHDIRIAAVFEIGRLLITHRITPMTSTNTGEPTLDHP